jgi:DNA polymerase II large subunit
LNKIEQRTVIKNLKQRPEKEEKERENYDRKKKRERKLGQAHNSPGTRRDAQTPQRAVYRISRIGSPIEDRLHQ